MALTITRTGFRDLDTAGIRLRRVVQLVGDASYPGGGGVGSGYPLTPGDLKLGVVEAFGACIFENAAGAIRIGYYDITNQRLRLYVPNTGAEVANGVDVSAFVARVEVLGK